MKLHIRPAIALLAATLLMALVPSATHAEDPASQRKLLIIGDSITSRYNDDPASQNQGWWSMVARKKGMIPDAKSSMGSSGFQITGPVCGKSSHYSRRGYIAIAKPDVIIVEGGRNDMYYCSGMKRKLNSKKRIDAGVKKYVAMMSVEAAKAGVSKRDVYFVTPWGTKDASYRKLVQPIVKKWARAYGFTFIDLPVIPNHKAPDKVHPNRGGNLSINNYVVAAMR